MFKDWEARIGVGVEEMTVVGFPVIRFSEKQLAWIDSQSGQSGDNREERLFRELAKKPGSLVSYEFSKEILKINKDSMRVVGTLLRRNIINGTNIGLYAVNGGMRLLPQLEENKWYLLPDEIPDWVAPELRVGYARSNAVKISGCNFTEADLLTPLTPQAKTLLDGLVASYANYYQVMSVKQIRGLLGAAHRTPAAGSVSAVYRNLSKLKECLGKVNVEIEIVNHRDVGYSLCSLKAKNGQNG